MAVACGSLTFLFPVGSFGSGLVRLLVVELRAPATISNGLRPGPVPRPYSWMVVSSSFGLRDDLTCQLPVVSSWLTERLRRPPSVMSGRCLILNVSIMKSRITPAGIHDEPSFAVISSWVSLSGSDFLSLDSRFLSSIRRSGSGSCAGWASIHSFLRSRHCPSPSTLTMELSGRYSSYRP